MIQTKLDEDESSTYLRPDPNVVMSSSIAFICMLVQHSRTDNSQIHHQIFLLVFARFKVTN